MIIVYTGNGEGRTTAALGLALRAIGQGDKVLFVQFLKSSRAYGEIKAARRLSPELEIIQVGKDCIYSVDDQRRYQCPDCDFACHVNPKNPDPADIEAAKKGLVLVEARIKSGVYNLIVLDEINYAVSYGLITVDKIMNLINNKPDKLRLVLTGRDAHSKLIEQADLVTEMCEIKHPFQQGLKSVKGVDL